MGVRLIKANETISFPAWVLPYPNSLMPSKREALMCAPEEGQYDLVAGQLRFKGDANDLLDGLALLAGADKDEKVIVDEGLTLSWWKKPGGKILLKTAGPAGARPIAAIQFDVLAEVMSSAAFADLG